MRPAVSIPLCVALVVTWAAADYGYDHAAEWFGSTGPRWHYVLTAWKSFFALALVALACRSWIPSGIALGMAWDEALKLSCGGARLWDVREWFARPGEGLCDGLGLHVYFVGLAAVAFFAVIITWQLYEHTTT